MLDNLSDLQRAAGFYLVTFALALVIVVFSDSFGAFTPLVTMLTPAAGVLVMMLVLTSEGRTPGTWFALGVARAGFSGWWLAIVGPIAILATSYAILVATGLATFAVPEAARSTVGDIAVDLTLGLAIGLVFAFGEEIGWRGYMLPKLAAIGIVPAMLVVGFLHGVWHLPIMLTTPFYHPDGNPMIVVPLFLTTLTLAGIFFGFLRVWTGSVWPVAIAHAVHNFTWAIGREFVTPDKPETMEYIGGESGILVIAGLLIATLILVPVIRHGGGGLTVMRSRQGVS